MDTTEVDDDSTSGFGGAQEMQFTPPAEEEVQEKIMYEEDICSKMGDSEGNCGDKGSGDATIGDEDHRCSESVAEELCDERSSEECSAEVSVEDGSSSNVGRGMHVFVYDRPSGSMVDGTELRYVV